MSEDELSPMKLAIYAACTLFWVIAPAALFLLATRPPPKGDPKFPPADAGVPVSKQP